MTIVHVLDDCSFGIQEEPQPDGSVDKTLIVIHPTSDQAWKVRFTDEQADGLSKGLSSSKVIIASAGDVPTANNGHG